jgi:thiamine-phosphate diphosphorylase
MICLVTDRRRLSAGSDAIERLVTLVGAAARAGVDLIHVRERDLEARELARLVRRCVKAAEGTGAKVVVNDRADVALAAGAGGVHLRSDSIPAGAVRSLLPAGASVGRSVHSADEASTISRDGAVDYLVFGALFQTPSKPPGHALAPLDELAAACRRAVAPVRLKADTAYGAKGRVPVLAIGGMTAERASIVARAGAAGIAGIGLFIPPPGNALDAHLHTIVGQLRGTFDTCQAHT